jgi:hypothetical protein
MQLRENHLIDSKKKSEKTRKKLRIQRSNFDNKQKIEKIMGNSEKYFK